MQPMTVPILIVDDDDVDVEGVERALVTQGLTNPIRRARDGIEALDILRGTNGAEKISRPRIILLDLNMPRMNGIAFLDELREDPNLKNSVVFVFTTSQDEQDRLQAYERHIAGYITKSKAGRDFSTLAAMLDHYWQIVELPTGEAA